MRRYPWLRAGGLWVGGLSLLGGALGNAAGDEESVGSRHRRTLEAGRGAIRPSGERGQSPLQFFFSQPQAGPGSVGLPTSSVSSGTLDLPPGFTVVEMPAPVNKRVVSASSPQDLSSFTYAGGERPIDSSTALVSLSGGGLEAIPRPLLRDPILERARLLDGDTLDRLARPVRLGADGAPVAQAEIDRLRPGQTFRLPGGVYGERDSAESTVYGVRQGGAGATVGLSSGNLRLQDVPDAGARTQSVPINARVLFVPVGTSREVADAARVRAGATEVRFGIPPSAAFRNTTADATRTADIRSRDGNLSITYLHSDQEMTRLGQLGDRARNALQDARLTSATRDLNDALRINPNLAGAAQALRRIGELQRNIRTTADALERGVRQPGSGAILPLEGPLTERLRSLQNQLDSTQQLLAPIQEQLQQRRQQEEREQQERQRRERPDTRPRLVDNDRDPDKKDDTKKDDQTETVRAPASGGDGASPGPSNAQAPTT